MTCWLAFSLGACGADDRPHSSLRLDAAGDGSLRFERSAVRVAAGRAWIETRNPSTIPHAIGVRGEGVEEIGETVGKGGTSSLEADLEPGAYELFWALAAPGLPVSGLARSLAAVPRLPVK